MIYTFHSPLDKAETLRVIERAVKSIYGKVKQISPSCLQAKWRSPYFRKLFPSKFMFYVGDGIVRVVEGTGTTQMLNMGPFKVAGHSTLWNSFVVSLVKTAPGVDFGIKPGEFELVEVQFFGDGTEQVFVSTTHHSPSWGGAALGGLLFGTAGAIIGGSGGTSYTSGKVSTRFSNEVLARGRYSNGLITEYVISKDSHLYHEIMVNMSRLSSEIER